MKADKREIQLRIAYEAARILTDNRSDDQSHAIYKAASRLGIHDKRMLPKREEVESVLREQQRLFRGSAQTTALGRLRMSALQAMKALEKFRPLLVGPVYAGTADSNSHVQLHLFADTPEEVVFALADLQIPWQERDRSLKFSAGSHKNMPCFQFNAGDTHFELVVLPSQGPYRRPLDPLDSRPTQGASIKQMALLLDQR